MAHGPIKFHDLSALEVLRAGETEAMEQLAQSAAFLMGFARGADARIEALEKRLHHLEDKVSEILQRSAGVGRVVSPTHREADSEQLPPDRDPEGGAEQTGDGVPLSFGGGEAVKRNA
jgi:hypothetical protein